MRTANPGQGQKPKALTYRAAYQNQQQVERGFRFLKNPLFLASSLYLKSPKRLMALMRVMTLCLLVYAALEDRLRQALKAHD